MWQVVAAMVWRLQSGFDALLPIPPALDDETDTDRLRAGHYKVRSKAASAVRRVQRCAACTRPHLITAKHTRTATRMCARARTRMCARARTRMQPRTRARTQPRAHFQLSAQRRALRGSGLQRSVLVVPRQVRHDVLVAVMLSRERRPPTDAADGCTLLAASLAALPSHTLKMIAEAVAALGHADV